MSFNTVYSDLACPACGENIASGVGFKVGSINQDKYHVGDELKWDGEECRPTVRPEDGNIVSVGYFNCDNINCSSWHDCYPEVQQALVSVRNNIITDVTILRDHFAGENFDIL